MAEWPDWNPPPEMIVRQPYLPRFMAGGETNPLGARALYLGDTAYRIHGTNQPSTIGTFVSSGCVWLTNEDIMPGMITEAEIHGRMVLTGKMINQLFNKVKPWVMQCVPDIYMQRLPTLQRLPVTRNT